MICTRYFNFIHVPKTGGIWVRSIFRGSAERAWVSPAPAKNLPADWWFYEPRDAEGRGLHVGVRGVPERYAGRPTLAFVRNPWDWYVSYFSYFRRKYAEGDDVEVFRATLPGLLATHSCTYACKPLIVDGAGNVACTVKKYEDGVAPQLRTFLSRACPFVPEPIEHAIEKRERQNASKRGPYQDYYTDQLAGQVARVDGWLIKRWEYSF
jgi:hypothetical protein